MAGEPMTIRLDLRIRYDLMAQSSRVLMAREPFGCADCGRWFQFARELVAHLREHAQGADDE